MAWRQPTGASSIVQLITDHGWMARVVLQSISALIDEVCITAASQVVIRSLLSRVMKQLHKATSIWQRAALTLIHDAPTMPATSRRSLLDRLVKTAVELAYIHPRSNAWSLITTTISWLYFLVCALGNAQSVGLRVIGARLRLQLPSSAGTARTTTTAVAAVTAEPSLLNLCVRAVLRRYLQTQLELLFRLLSNSTANEALQELAEDGVWPLNTTAVLPQHERTGALLGAYVTGLDSHFARIGDTYVGFCDAAAAAGDKEKDELSTALTAHIATLTSALSEALQAANASYSRACISNEFAACSDALSRLSDSWIRVANTVHKLSESTSDLQQSRKDTAVIREVRRRLREVQRATAGLSRVAAALVAFEAAMAPSQYSGASMYSNTAATTSDVASAANSQPSWWSLSREVWLPYAERVVSTCAADIVSSVLLGLWLDPL